MKKGIIVLLIAVLVAGFAFAGKLTGDATIKFDTDLKAKTWGFANTQSWKYTFSFEFTAPHSHNMVSIENFGFSFFSNLSSLLCDLLAPHM